MTDKGVPPHFCDECPPSYEIICENGIWKEFDIGGDDKPRLVQAHLNYCPFCGWQLMAPPQTAGVTPVAEVVNPHRGTNDHDDYDY